MLNKIKRWGVMLGLASIALLASGCGQNNSDLTGGQLGDDGKLAIYTTLYPLQYVTERIGGEHATVTNVVPPGVEAHDFEPTAKELVRISKGDLLVYNGGGFEAWVEKAATNFSRQGMNILEATEGLPLLASGAHVEGEEHHEGDGHDHGSNDPHVWLDPTLLAMQAEKVKDALIKIDPDHKQEYEENYTELRNDLNKLDQDFKEMTSQAKKKEFVVSHQAFTYLANRYNLQQISISGVSPEDEPSPSELKELVEMVKEKQVSYIMFETLASPKVAEVIAREAKVKTAVLNPLEGLLEEEQKHGKDYLSIMRDNLKVLETALNE
ncbi:metal ABC transporter substrate-binding protein [Brevibacillus daliensis]|uniref:metal ABC transporter substrate-binding protein n=1 Tax=Brevibacillus daliensis TaxID=2892995 RepID=UPI001E4C8267|nr:metal ABC transporter substrate-binding protein [Brevibacillus daliensis]